MQLKEKHILGAYLLFSIMLGLTISLFSKDYSNILRAFSLGLFFFFPGFYFAELLFRDTFYLAKWVIWFGFSLLLSIILIILNNFFFQHIFLATTIELLFITLLLRAVNRTHLAARVFSVKVDWLLLLILVVGFLMRGLYPSLIPFSADQAEVFQFLLRMNAGHFPLIGALAGGLFRMGPLIYYLYYVPFLIFPGVLSVFYFCVIANVLSIFLLFKFMERYLNKPSAYISSALYAVALYPSLIVSRGIRYDPLILPVLILYMFFIFEIIKQKEYSSMLYYMAFATYFVATQVHLTLAPFGLFLVVIALKHLKKMLKDWKLMLTLIVTFILLYGSWLYSLFKGTFGFHNSNLIHFGGFIQRALYVFDVGSHLKAFLGANLVYYGKLVEPVLKYLAIACLLFSIWIAFACPKKRRFIGPLWLWYLIGVVPLSLFKYNPPVHYYIAVFLLPWIFIGLVIGTIVGKYRIIMLISLLLVVILNLCSAIQYFHLVNDTKGIDVGQGLPFKEKFDVIKQLTERFKVASNVFAHNQVFFYNSPNLWFGFRELYDIYFKNQQNDEKSYNYLFARKGDLPSLNLKGVDIYEGDYYYILKYKPLINYSSLRSNNERIELPYGWFYYQGPKNISFSIIAVGNLSLFVETQACIKRLAIGRDEHFVKNCSNSPILRPSWVGLQAFNLSLDKTNQLVHLSLVPKYTWSSLNIYGLLIR